MTDKLKLNNHDAYCVEWYRRLIADGTAEDGQRIAVQMHDEAMRLTADLNRANDECLQIDKNATTVKKEHKAEIKKLRAECDKVVEHIEQVMKYCNNRACKFCKKRPKRNDIHCIECNPKYSGLEESE